MLLLGALVEPGTVAGWLTLVAIVATAWVVWRGGGGAAMGTLETANRVLGRKLRADEERIVELEQRVAELTGRTDVTLALKPLLEWTASHEQRAQERHEGAERRAQERHEATLKGHAELLAILGLVADRLGPEPPNGVGSGL